MTRSPIREMQDATKTRRKALVKKTELSVGIYARDSTQVQQALPSQLKAMREHVKAGFYNLAIDFTEVG